MIQPVNPQVVYLPQYDPTVVYGRPGAGVGLVTFGIAIGITALLVSQPWGWGGWGWNWGGRRIDYNRGPWGGWGGGYRPPHPYYRPRPVVYRNRPGYGGNWGYRPPNYRPPQAHQSPRNPAGVHPSYEQPVNRPPVLAHLLTTRPPNNNRPPNGGNPSIQPVRPGTPNNRPPQRPTGTRPPQVKPPQTRPAPNRPAPQNRPAQPRTRLGTTPTDRPGGSSTSERRQPTEERSDAWRTEVSLT